MISDIPELIHKRHVTNINKIRQKDNCKVSYLIIFLLSYLLWISLLFSGIAIYPYHQTVIKPINKLLICSKDNTWFTVNNMISLDEENNIIKYYGFNCSNVPSWFDPTIKLDFINDYFDPNERYYLNVQPMKEIKENNINMTFITSTEFELQSKFKFNRIYHNEPMKYFELHVSMFGTYTDHIPNITITIDQKRKNIELAISFIIIGLVMIIIWSVLSVIFRKSIYF